MLRNILFIDNEDSFVYNLVDAYASRGHSVDVFRCDWPIDEATGYLMSRAPDLVVLSPGPKGPREATLCMQLLERAGSGTKFFGVCLGFQCIVECFGGRVEPTDAPIHGKTASVEHDGGAMWAGVENPFSAGRYHSLAATTVSDELVVIATMGSMVMAVRHRERPIIGVQFHPESVLTPTGLLILDNVLSELCPSVLEGSRLES